MAARSLWNGTIAFGELSIPVKLYPAVQDRRVHFHEVRLSDGCPIVHRKVGSDSGVEVPAQRIAKSYETSRGQQVVLDDQEIAAARGSRPKVIEIEHFVQAGQIDLVYYDRPYVVGAQPGAERSYRVLLAATQRAKQVGIGRFVLRTREQLIALAPWRKALMLYTMHFADEVLEPSDLKVPAMRREPSKQEIAMAERLIDTLAADWRPASHKDRYRKAVLTLIERKAAGGQIERASPPRRQAPDDLLGALQESLEGRAHKRPSKHRPARSRGDAKRSKTKTRSRR